MGGDFSLFFFCAVTFVSAAIDMSAGEIINGMPDH